MAAAQCTRKVNLVHFSCKAILKRKISKKLIFIILGHVLKHYSKKKGGPFGSNRFQNNFEHNSLGNIFRSISEHFAAYFITSHTLIKVKSDNFSPHFTPEGFTSLKV